MIVNKSLESGIVPKYFKKAIVVPALKKPTLNPEEKVNFRPVSNLSCTAKITERVVFGQLEAHLKQHLLPSPTQSAYRRYHSTETMLVKVTKLNLTCIDMNIQAARCSKTFLAYQWLDSAVLCDQYLFTQ